MIAQAAISSHKFMKAMSVGLFQWFLRSRRRGGGSLGRQKVLPDCDLIAIAPIAPALTPMQTPEISTGFPKLEKQKSFLQKEER